MCILGSSGISNSLDPVLIPKSFLSAGDAANTTLPCLSVFPTTSYDVIHVDINCIVVLVFHVKLLLFKINVMDG